jgi:drug/metabolite transporter (DMT)-like permease
MWVSGAAGVALAIQAVATGDGRLQHGSHQWVPVIAVAVFSAGAFACLFAGLRRIGAVRTSIVAASEPLVAATLSVIFLDERVRAGTVAGGALILVGAVAAALARRDATGPRAEPQIP